GVVDEDVQLGLARRDFVGQALALRLRGEISRQRDALADLGELYRHLVAHVGLARRDVDPRTRLDHAARNHQADAARTAGHDCRLAVDREEVAGHGRRRYLPIGRGPRRVPTGYGIPR